MKQQTTWMSHIRTVHKSPSLMLQLFWKSNVLGVIMNLKILPPHPVTAAAPPAEEDDMGSRSSRKPSSRALRRVQRRVYRGNPHVVMTQLSSNTFNNVERLLLAGGGGGWCSWSHGGRRGFGRWPGASWWPAGCSRSWGLGWCCSSSRRSAVGCCFLLQRKKTGINGGKDSYVSWCDSAAFWN